MQAGVGDRVERDASSMPSAVDQSAGSGHAAGTRTVYTEVGGVYSRPLTSSGGRNMQDSSFSLSAMSDSQYNAVVSSAIVACNARQFSHAIISHETMT